MAILDFDPSLIISNFHNDTNNYDYVQFVNANGI